jgi:ubiquinone/menaquinone biosynthesis C-methylase UbiE
VSSKDYFDEIAGQWDSMQQSFFSEDVREAALLRAAVKEGQLAGDIGAGSGFITAGLLREGLRVIAIDQSENMLAEMQSKFANVTGIEYRRGDADTLPVETGTLDHAFANMYLHHVDDPADAIREMSRTLKPGGMLVITDLDAHEFDFLKVEHHDRWMGFRREDVTSWFKSAGLVDVNVEPVGSECCSTSSSDCATEANIGIWIASGRKPA